MTINSISGIIHSIVENLPFQLNPYAKVYDQVNLLACLYEIKKKCLCDTPNAHLRQGALVCDQMFSCCAYVSFSLTIRDRGFIFGVHLHLGKPTESSELYLMLIYISWFTALRKKCSSAGLGQFLSNQKK